MSCQKIKYLCDYFCAVAVTALGFLSGKTYTNSVQLKETVEKSLYACMRLKRFPVAQRHSVSSSHFIILSSEQTKSYNYFSVPFCTLRKSDAQLMIIFHYTVKNMTMRLTWILYFTSSYYILGYIKIWVELIYFVRK